MARRLYDCCRGPWTGRRPGPLLLIGPQYANVFAVNRLTKREQLVLCIVLGLLLLGWSVKVYRSAHPPTFAVEPVKL